ncbi:hypothetical protein [Nocardia sp. CS682]|uniref:hypothetical protein n=1 Tax=Nocardia sp. CS682 TaxID=1047172 RepID=UPI0010757528|nr:hypothetical protein [Nocardia sp. CS682]QBS43849.1 hypothetical protein DMB37_30880 [Nocardia sp. CS682]
MSDAEITVLIRDAAEVLRDEMRRTCSRLADEILDRPAFGSPEWFEQWHARDTPEGRRRLADEHLTKMRIYTAAGVDCTGDAINAQAMGASNDEMAEVCGLTSDAVIAKWGKFFGCLGAAGA